MLVASPDTPLHLTLGANVDYLRQQGLGPGLGRVSLDLNLFPFKDVTTFLPHIGASFSENISGGEQSLWSGTRPGLEGIVGFDLALGHNLANGVALEERLGSVRGMERFYTTRLAFVIGL